MNGSRMYEVIQTYACGQNTVLILLSGAAPLSLSVRGSIGLMDKIHSKNPDSKLIDKMVSIARHFDAAVLGDDDESYVGGDQAPRPSKLSFSERVVNLFARYRRQRAPEVEHTPLPFDVGDTVHDLWGNEHTVIRIDLQALHGAGMIWTRRRDGTELGHMMTEHHLEPTTTKGTS